MLSCIRVVEKRFYFLGVFSGLITKLFDSKNYNVTIIIMFSNFYRPMSYSFKQETLSL